MNITDLLMPDRVSCRDDLGSKKRLLEYVSELLAGSSPKLTQNEIFDALINREKLGRIASLERPVCAFVRLATPVDFDATDGQPVDLIFTLLVPEDSTEEHLQVLSTIAEIFSNAGISMALRQCDTDSCLLEQLCQWEARRISA